MALALPTLDGLAVSGKRVIVRVDLNVPMEGGRIADATRVIRLLPTINELANEGAKIILLAHFDRPNGKFVPSMSLAPLVDAVAELFNREVKFGVDCVGSAAEEAVANIPPGGIVLLENLRFHAEEEANDKTFAAALAKHGDIYVNDAFSCSHRAHASTDAITHYLPSYAGRLLAEEVSALDAIFSAPRRPLAALIGGSKVSTKLTLLSNLINKVDVIAIGGAMANTFLLAQGHNVGKSICERDMATTARDILAAAEKSNCRILLPVDLVVTEKFAERAPCKVVSVDRIPAHMTATDVGPQTIGHFAQALIGCGMIVWNGPVGAFETSPFDAGTIAIARVLARLTGEGKVQTIAGGGDTVAAVAHAGLSDAFTYLSTAGGAFLEWLEGKELPGIAALAKKTSAKKKEAVS